jgi:hypothetical protein
MSTPISTPPRPYRPPSVYDTMSPARAYHNQPRPYRPPSVYDTTSPVHIPHNERRPYRPPSMYVNSEYIPRRLNFETVTFMPTSIEDEKTIILPMCNKKCECTICMTEEEENTSSVGTLPCGHAFHTYCINKWFHNNNTCPNCRAIVDVQSLMQ